MWTRRSATALCAGLLGLAGALTFAAPAEASGQWCTDARSMSTRNLTWTWMPVVPGRNPYSLHDPQCDIQRGDTGNDVKALQDSLNKCYGRSLVVDGQFGSKTQAALQHAQRTEGLSDDGFYDGWSEAHWLRFYGHYIDGNGNVRYRCARWEGGSW
jgi:hypothetical protein